MINKWWVLSLLGCLLLLMNRPAAAQEFTEGKGTIELSGSMVNGRVYDQPPANNELVVRSRDFLAQPKQHFAPQVDPAWKPGPPLNPEVAPYIPETQAPGDYETIRNTNLNPTGNTSVVDEPSLAQSGRTILYTGNWFAGYSGDYGQSWSYYNPYDNFPADGTTDVPTGSNGSSSFCCDQVSTYDDQHDAFFWYLQYIKDAQGDNVGRIAVARGQAGVLNNSYCWYDFDSSLLGGSAGEWLDFPHIATSNNYLYVTSNVFNNANLYQRSVIWRMPLDAVSACVTTAYSFYTNSTYGTFRMVDNAASTMYWAANGSTTNLRVFSWPETGGVTSRNITHSGQTFAANSAPCPDGTDNGARSNSRVLAGWRSTSASNGTEVGFMWIASQNATRPYPYVKMLRIDVSPWALIQEFDIWSNIAAWLYPSVAVNQRGHLGGTIFYGCGPSQYPLGATWLVDDFTSPVYPNIDGFAAWTFATSNDGPNSNKWGDYVWAQQHVPYRNTWVGTGFRLSGGGNNSNTVPEFVWWGRERDLPPAFNTIYVDNANTGTFETGEAVHPYNTIVEGNFAAMPGDLIIIKGGTPYIETLIFDKSLLELRKNPVGGSVVIGGN